MRYIIFVLGLGSMVIGISSRFEGILFSFNFGAQLVEIGNAYFRNDTLLMFAGALLMLLSIASMRPNRI
jgi:hypothetical protein